MSQIGVGWFNDGKEAVYIAGRIIPPGVSHRFKNFPTLDELRAFVGKHGTGIYDLWLPNRYPTVNPLSPEDREYLTKK